jgi:hypothetical protein
MGQSPSLIDSTQVRCNQQSNRQSINLYISLWNRAKGQCLAAILVICAYSVREICRNFILTDFRDGLAAEKIINQSYQSIFMQLCASKHNLGNIARGSEPGTL